MLTNGGLGFIADLSSPNGFDEAIKGVQYIAHTASPFTCAFVLQVAVNV